MTCWVIADCRVPSVTAHTLAPRPASWCNPCWASFPNFLFAPVEKQAGGLLGRRGVCSLSWGVSWALGCDLIPPPPAPDSGPARVACLCPSHLVHIETGPGRWGCNQPPGQACRTASLGLGSLPRVVNKVLSACGYTHQLVASCSKGQVPPTRREDWH